MEQEMVSDFQKIIRKARTEAMYYRFNSNGALADVLEEMALGMENTLNKYGYVTQMRPGDSRGMGWRSSPWIGFAAVTFHSR